MFTSSSGRARGQRRKISMLVATVVIGLCMSNLAPVGSAAAGSTNLVDTSIDTSSGLSAPIGDLPGWNQIFVDDFNTDVDLGDFPEAVSGKWRAYPYPWKDSTGHGTYSPHAVVSIHNGILNEHLHTSDGTARVAAIIPRLPGTDENGRKYGRFAVRFRADLLYGYKMAWMLWPDSGGAANGEIDFPERNLASSVIKGFMHYTDPQFVGDQDNVKLPFDGTEWHTTVIEWSPNLVIFKLDGVEIQRTTERIPDTPMHWVLQTETQISPPDRPDPSTAGNVQIDWVAAWAYGNSSVTADTTPPTVSVTAPLDGAVVSGTIAMSAKASDADSVTAAKWYVDDQEVAYDGGVAPWTDPWDTTTVANGEHRLMAKARDASGNWGTSATVTVTVKN